MSLSSWIDPRVSQVTVAQVREYMRRHGWVEEASRRPEVIIFGGKDDDDNLPIFFVIPALEHISDYRLRLVELIGSLGVIEERYAGDILTEMLASAEANGTVPHEPANTAEVAGT